MCVSEDKIPAQVSRVLNLIPESFIYALLILHNRLEANDIEWALGGDFAEALKVVKVNPADFEIVTSKENAERIFDAVEEFKPEAMGVKIQQLPRNAVIGGEEYPIYIRSYFFSFFVGGIAVRVHGDLQYRINGWDYGDKLEFAPEYVFLMDKKIALVPLSLKYEIYQRLGWADRLDKIKQALEKAKCRPLGED
jgi:hypothetical protein